MKLTARQSCLAFKRYVPWCTHCTRKRQLKTQDVLQGTTFVNLVLVCLFFRLQKWIRRLRVMAIWSTARSFIHGSSIHRRKCGISYLPFPGGPPVDRLNVSSNSISFPLSHFLSGLLFWSHLENAEVSVVCPNNVYDDWHERIDWYSVLYTVHINVSHVGWFLIYHWKLHQILVAHLLAIFVKTFLHQVTGEFMMLGSQLVKFQALELPEKRCIFTNTRLMNRSFNARIRGRIVGGTARRNFGCTFRALTRRNVPIWIAIVLLSNRKSGEWGILQLMHGLEKS